MNILCYENGCPYSVLEPGPGGKWWSVPNDPVVQEKVMKLLQLISDPEARACLYLEGWYDGMKYAGY